MPSANSYGALLTAARTDLHRLAAQGELILVAATRGAADDFLRASSGTGFLGVRAFTLNHLAVHLSRHRVSQLGLAPLGAISQQALVARVANQHFHQLAYFAPVAGRPGFIRALNRTLHELRMERTDLAQLAATGDPGADLALLARAYQRELESGRYADLARLYALALEAFPTHPFAQLPLLLLDPPIRLDLERALVQSWPAFTALPDLEPAGDTTLDKLRRRLFASATPDPEPLDDTVAYFSAAGEALECVEIARRILKTGVPLDEIAIALRAPDRYQALLADALRRAGLPAYFSRGTMRPDPAGRALLALLQCARERLSASRFAEYLSLAQIPDRDQNGAPIRAENANVILQDEILAAFTQLQIAPPDDLETDAPILASPSAWERMLVDTAVIGGRQRWQRRLLGREFELRQQLQTLDADHEDRREGLERSLRQLRDLRNFALPLIALLDGLPKQASWGTWLQHLEELAATAIRLPNSIAALLAALRPMASVGPVTLDEVYGVLEEHLLETRRDPEGHRFGKVFIATPEELRGRTFTIVFLPGLAEGIFPPKVTEDPLLLDEYREPLALDKRDARVTREREQVHIAAAAAHRQLVFSYPRMDVGQARPRVPSFYALELVKAARGAMPDLREFEHEASAATPTSLGWPTPAHTADAIDDTEYDLTTLVRAGGRGAGRYLMDVSPTLARALRTRFLRWRDTWSTADGLIADPKAPTLDLSPYHLATRAYSPTALQSFAHCPYRFLLQAIYRLAPRDQVEAIEQLDPLTRGSIFHKVQQLTIEKLQSLDLLPYGRDQLDAVFNVIDEILNTVARQQEEDLAPAIPRVWTSEIEEMRTDLRGWARHMTAEGVDWYPIQAEYAFHDIPLFNQWLVTGRIDAIERHTILGGLRITDYKTGRPPVNPTGLLGGGTMLQPVIYALAASQKLGEDVHHGRLFYCTQRGGYKELERPLNANTRERLQTFFNSVQYMLDTAFLPAAPAKDACRLCDYRPVCGPYEERRAARKPQERLVTLEAIRQL